MAKSLYRPLKLGNYYITQCFVTPLVIKPILSKVRLYSSTANKAESGAPIYTKTDHEYKTTKKTAIQTLEGLLGIKTFNAFDIVSKNKSLRNAGSATIKSNHAVYLRKGVTHETLVKYPELLAVPNLEEKLVEIEKLPHQLNLVAVLLLLPLKILQKFVQSELDINQSKIVTLLTHLHVPIDKACEFIVSKPFLCSLFNEKIESTIKLLTDFGVSLEDIYNDLWVLRYSNEIIQSRLSFAKTHNMDTMKTWMVRAQPEIFQTYIQRRSDNKSILGNSSLAEYLSERLQCKIDVANYLILKQPVLKNKSLKKLKELIDFLYAEGFQPYHICRVPKILVHSVETTRKRLKQLEDKGIQIDSLHMLTKSQKQFNQYYEILVKNKNKLKK